MSRSSPMSQVWLDDGGVGPAGIGTDRKGAIRRTMGLVLPIVLRRKNGFARRVSDCCRTGRAIEFSPAILGSHSALDAHMLLEFGTDEIRRNFLEPMVAGKAISSYGMTEPEHSGSFPSLITTWPAQTGAGQSMAENGLSATRTGPLLLPSWRVLPGRCRARQGALDDRRPDRFARIQG